MSELKSALITGANSGIGKEVARQLAQREEFGRIYLFCRNHSKATAAQADLQRDTGRSVFEIVVADLSKASSVRAAAENLSAPLDVLVMNAGGTGGTAPLASTSDGVTEIFASNVLGHVVLAERLLDRGLLRDVGVLAGSEAARGVPKLRIPRPTFRDRTPEEFESVIDGSFFTGSKPNKMLAYGQVKYLGALWLGSLARRYPQLRLLTVSPGNTAGTEALRDLPLPVRVAAQRILMPYVAPALGIGHRLEVGAKRIVDAVVDPSMRSGVFYASAANTLTGPLVDQAEIVPDFGDQRIQDAANAAIHRFVP